MSITHINLDPWFDDEKLLEEAEKLTFNRVSVKADDYKPDSNGLVYMSTGSITIIDEDISYFEKTLDLQEGYHYDVAQEICDIFGIKEWRVKILRYSPGDKIFSHLDNAKLNPCAINHLFGGLAPIIFNQKDSVDYKTAIIDISRTFHKVVNTSDEIRYTLKIIPMDKTYEELKEIARRLGISVELE